MKTLSTTDIQELIPHRYPFLLVDTVDIIEDAKKAIGTKCVTANEAFFQGHFPGRPIMPGVLIVEALAQTACVLLGEKLRAENKIAFFLGIENVKFRQPVTPGSVLKLHCEVLKLGGRTGRCHGEAFLGDKLAVEADMSVILTEK